MADRIPSRRRLIKFIYEPSAKQKLGTKTKVKREKTVNWRTLFEWNEFSWAGSIGTAMTIATPTTKIIIMKQRTVIKFYCCNVGRSVCGTCSQLTDVCTQNQQKASYRPRDAERSAQGKQLRGHMSQTHSNRERASERVSVCEYVRALYRSFFLVFLLLSRGRERLLAFVVVLGVLGAFACVWSCSICLFFCHCSIDDLMLYEF